jgi:hypothetical protein
MCTEPKLTSNWHSRADTLSLPLLPACVFVIRDTVRIQDVFCSENSFVNRIVREQGHSWTEVPLYNFQTRKISFRAKIKNRTLTYSESHQLILQNSVDSHTSSGEEQSTRKQGRSFKYITIHDIPLSFRIKHKKSHTEHIEHQNF